MKIAEIEAILHALEHHGEPGVNAQGESRHISLQNGKKALASAREFILAKQARAKKI